MDPWFEEFKRKLDELNARVERRRVAREQRVAAVEPRIGGHEQTGATLVVADNWGGLFDEIPILSDKRETVQIEAQPFSVVVPLEQEAVVVPDNWGGLFEQPDRPWEQRGHNFTADIIFAGPPSSVQIYISNLEAEPEQLLGFCSVPEEHIIDPIATVVASSDSAPDNTSIDTSSACLTVTPVVSSAVKGIESEEFPLQIQERVEVVEVDEKDSASTGSEVFKAIVVESNADQLPTERFRASTLDRDSLAQGALSALRPLQQAPLRRPRFRRLWRAPLLRRLWRLPPRPPRP